MNFKQLSKYSLSETFSDIMLISGLEEKGSLIPSHKVILASCSGYVRELLKSNPGLTKIILPKPIRPVTQEIKSDPTSKVISLCYRQFDIQELLDSGFGKDNCLSFYSIANSLKMDFIEDKIVEYIDQNLMNPNAAAQFYLEASKFGNLMWEKKALDLLAGNFHQILNSPEDYRILIDLPYSSFKAMIAREDLQVASEDPILELVKSYITARETLERNPIHIPPEEPKEEEEAPAETPPPEEPAPAEGTPEGDVNNTQGIYSSENR